MRLDEPVVIKRFTPPDFAFCDPDAPVFYNPTMQTEVISTRDDVIRLAQQLCDAENNAWRNHHAGQLFELVADSAKNDLAECQRYLLAIGLPGAVDLARCVGKLYLRLKDPTMACIAECLEEIYIKDGMSAVKAALDRLGKDKEGDAE